MVETTDDTTPSLSGASGDETAIAFGAWVFYAEVIIGALMLAGIAGYASLGWAPEEVTSEIRQNPAAFEKIVTLVNNSVLGLLALFLLARLAHARRSRVASWILGFVAIFQAITLALAISSGKAQAVPPDMQSLAESAFSLVALVQLAGAGALTWGTWQYHRLRRSQTLWKNVRLNLLATVGYIALLLTAFNIFEDAVLGEIMFENVSGEKTYVAMPLHPINSGIMWLILIGLLGAAAFRKLPILRTRPTVRQHPLAP